LFAQEAQIFQQIFKILTPISEIMTPFLVGGGEMENVYVMVRPKVPHIDINKHTMVV
jgi:hypothetical protein